VRVPLFLGLIFSCGATAADSNLVDRIGSLSNLAGDRCVATLVDSSLLLTAAHCLFDETGRALSPSELSFVVSSKEVHSILGYVLHPDFEATSEPSVLNIAADLALLLLRHPIVGLGKLPQGQPVFQGDLVLLGLPNGLVRCRVANQAGSVLALDCRVAFGDSGAGVFMEQSEAPGRYRLVGVVSAFEAENNANAAIAGEILIDLTELGEQLPSQAIQESPPPRPDSDTSTGVFPLFGAP